MSVCLCQKTALVPAVTLTFDLLTSKCYQFICVSNCTEVGDLARFPLAVFKILC